MSIKSRNIVINTVADLANIQPGNGDIIEILGYNDIGDGGGQIVRYDGTASNAVDGGFVFYGPGLLGRYIAIEQERANVRRFGAVGDGITNDTAAVQAAVDAMSNVNGTVYFPVGTYLATVTMTSDSKTVNFIGEGERSILEAASVNQFALSIDASFPRSLIRDIKIEGASKTKHGIYINTGAGVKFERVRVDQCGIGTLCNASIGLKWSQCTYRTSHCAMMFTTRDTGNLLIEDVTPSGDDITITPHTFEQHSGFHHLVGVTFDVNNIAIYQDNIDNGFDDDAAIVLTQCLLQNGKIGIWAKESGRPGSHPIKLDNTWIELDSTPDTITFDGVTKNNNDLIVDNGRIEGDNVRPNKLELNNFGVMEFRNSKLGDSFSYTKSDTAQLRFDDPWLDNEDLPFTVESFRLFNSTQGRPSSAPIPLRSSQKMQVIRNQGDIENLSYSGNVDIDFSEGSYNRKSITLTGDLTIDSLSAPVPGFYELRLLQDGTGGHSITFPTLADSGTILTESGAGELNIVDLYYDGTSWHEKIPEAKLLYSVMGVKAGDDTRINNYNGTKTYNASAVTPIGQGAIKVVAASGASYTGPRIKMPKLRENTVGLFTFYARSDESCIFQSIGNTGTWTQQLTPEWRCYAAMTIAQNPTGDFTDWYYLRTNEGQSFEVCGIQILEFQNMESAVLYLKSGTLTNGESVSFENYANVKDYGAIGDGSTDDTDAIQEAIDSGTLKIFFPDGTYNISSQLTVNEGQTLTGTGTLKKTTTGDWAIFYIDSDYVTIDGLISEGADTGPSDELLSGFAHINGTTGCVIRNCRVTKVDGAGIILTDANNCTISNNFIFDSSTTHSSAADILLRGNCNAAKITNNHCGSDCNAGIYAGFTPGDSDLIITDNHCITLNASGGENYSPSIRRHGILSHYTAAGTSSRMVVANNVVRHTKWSGIYCNGNSDKIQIHDNQISHTALDYGGGSPLAGGIMINGEGRFISVQGNMISDVGDSLGGIRVTPSPDSGSDPVDSYVFIHANTIDNCPDRAIHVGGYTSRVMISDNMIVGTSIDYSGEDPSAAPYGIYIAPQAGITPDDLTIMGNFITMPTFGFAMYVNWDDSPTKQPVITNNILRCIDNTDGNRQNSAGVLMRRYHGIINNNSIEGFSVGVRIFEQIDPNVRGYRVEHNKIQGEWAFGASSSAGNTDRTMFFGTSNKVEVTGSIFKDSANLGRAAGAFGDLQGDGTVLITDSAPPIYGTYIVGDRVINSAPSVGGVSEWVCTSSGTPGTWTEVRQSDFLNVRDYGAVGNGSTDDTAAIQAALSAVPDGGGTVLFPPGIYITDPIQISTYHTTLRGESAVLTASGGVVIQVSGRDCTLDGLIIDGNLTAGQGINVFDGADRVRIKNCEIYDVQDDGATADGIYVADCREVDISHNYIHDISTLDGSPSRGIRFSSTDSGALVTGICAHNRIDHVYPRDDGDGIVMQGYPERSSLLIDGNILTRCAKRAIKIQSPGAVVSNNLCIMTLVGSGLNPRCAITTQEDYSTVTGNQLTVTAVDAAMITSGSGVVVSNNNVTFVSAGGNCDGIYSPEGFKHFTVANNTFAGGCRFGMKIDGDTSHGAITGNSFDDLSNHGINFLGSGCEDITITGNVITNLTGFSAPIVYGGGGVPERVVSRNNVYDGSGGSITYTDGNLALRNANPLTIMYGTGSPDGVVSSSVGHRYIRTDGGTGTTLYIKESGTGNTGWVAK